LGGRYGFVAVHQFIWVAGGDIPTRLLLISFEYFSTKWVVHDAGGATNGRIAENRKSQMATNKNRRIISTYKRGKEEMNEKNGSNIE